MKYTDLDRMLLARLTLKLAGYFAKHIQAQGGGFVEPPQEFWNG